jgi:hypothetical protein
MYMVYWDMCVCIYIYMYMHMYTYMYIYKNMLHVHVGILREIYIYRYPSILMPVCAFVCVCVYGIYMYVLYGSCVCTAAA